MTRSPTDIIQSFRLRFWLELAPGAPGNWRGDVWHEQQHRGEQPVAVVSPEEAFDHVRKTLNRFSMTHIAATEQFNQSSVKASQEQLSPTKHLNPVLTIWRKLRGERS